MGKKSELREQIQAEEFVRQHVARCPLCKQKDTAWGFEHSSFMMDKQVKFTCPNCHAILESSYGEMKGVGSSLPEWLQAGGGYQAVMRSVYHKKKGVTYVRILDTGMKEKAQEYLHKEIPLEELKELF